MPECIRKYLLALLAVAVMLTGAQALTPALAGAETAEEGADDELCSDWLTGALERCAAVEEEDTEGGGSDDGDDYYEDSDDYADDEYYDDLDCTYGGACGDESDEEYPEDIGFDDTSDGFHTGDPCIDYGHCRPDIGEGSPGSRPTGPTGVRDPTGDLAVEDDLQALNDLAEAERRAAEEVPPILLHEAETQAEAALKRIADQLPGTESIRLRSYCREIRQSMNEVNLELDDRESLFARSSRSLTGKERNKLAKLRGFWRVNGCDNTSVPRPRPH
jgi:hypothetical protein